MKYTAEKLEKSITVLDRLLASTEPSIHYKLRVNVLGEAANSPEIRKLQQEVKDSPQVRALLSERDETGKIIHHPYAKWDGAHWVTADVLFVLAKVKQGRK